jgi:hypothetical protein
MIPIRMKIYWITHWIGLDAKILRPYKQYFPVYPKLKYRI